MKNRAAGILAALFFLEFVVKGTILPLTSLYCRDYLGFDGIRTGLVLTTETVAAFLAPAVLIFLADRVIRVEKLLVMNQLAASLLLFLVPSFRAFAPVFILFFLFNIFHKPDLPLLNAITFRNLDGSGKNSYGAFRVWGTIGWIGAAVIFSCIWMNTSLELPFGRTFGGLFYIAGTAALASSMLLLFGQRHFRQDRSERGRAGGSGFFRALREMNRRTRLRFGTFILICIVMTMQDHYYFMGISPFLKDTGTAEGNIALIISLGMITEVVAMFALRFLLDRFGIGRIMAAGAFFSVLKYMLFISAPGGSPVIIGILCHGPVSAFFLACTYIYLDSFSRPENRAAFHQFYSLAVSAPASLLGYMLGGLVFDSMGSSYNLFWAVPAVTGALSLAAILFFIKPVDGQERV